MIIVVITIIIIIIIIISMRAGEHVSMRRHNYASTPNTRSLADSVKVQLSQRYSTRKLIS